MPLVKTYGKHVKGIVKSHSWLSPEVEDGNVFSSPDVDLETTDVTSPPSIEKERRNASAAVDRPTAKETKGRKAKPKTFVPFFSESEEYNSDKENFVPDTTDTPGLPDLKVLQSRNILRPPKSIPHAQINESHITQRRHKKSSSSSSSSTSSQSISSRAHRRKRRLSSLSRSSRKLRQDDGALCELGKRSSSSSSGSTASSWHPSSVDTGSTCSSQDRSWDLFSISESVGSHGEMAEADIDKSGTPEAKRKRNTRNGKQKCANEKEPQISTQTRTKDTSTPLTAYHSACRSYVSPVLFDITLSPPTKDDTLPERCILNDSVFQGDISEDLNQMSITNHSDSFPLPTSRSKSSASTVKPARHPNQSQSNSRSRKQKDQPGSRHDKFSEQDSLQIKNSKRDSKTGNLNITYTIRKSRCEKSNSSSTYEIGKENGSLERNQTAQTKRLRRKRKVKTDMTESESREEESTGKISPCTILLEKLPAQFLNTPPRNKHHSRLFDCDNNFKESLTPTRDRKSGHIITARSKVLQQCQQTEPLPFNEILSESEILTCVKVGEGAYGEVFLTTNQKKESVALKIIPVEGDFKVNDEPQKTFEEILPEIVISRELSSMQTGSVNQTRNFIQVNRVACIQGAYPERLIEEWDVYHAEKASENDRPDIFDENQLFILFEFSNGGIDLEAVEFTNIGEAISILRQVAGALAAAECQYGFEHRDLHWGNVLVRKSKRAKVAFKVEGDTFAFRSHGVEASIIDFTLSRLNKDGCTVFCDLALDETLFIGKGDYQFDIYRKMKKENKNEWEAFNPHSNVLWLHYLLEKILKNKSFATEPSKETVRELKTFGRHLLGHSSAEEVLRESELLQLLEDGS